MDQACSSASTTEARNARPATQTGQDTVAIISDSSASSGGTSQPHRGARAKRRKRTRASTTPPFSGATQESETESERSQTGFRAPAPPLLKRLPTDIERMAEIRHAPAANLAANLMEVVQEVEKVAASSNIKVTYKRRLRDAAGKVREDATELAKRTTVAGCEVALEQENLRLRTQLQQAEAMIAELSKAATNTSAGSSEKRVTGMRVRRTSQ